MRYINPDLLSKIKEATQKDFKIKAKIERPKTPVTDTTQFIVDTIRTGDNLGDIATDSRRTNKNHDYDKIFEIHVDNSMVKTATIKMPVDPTKIWIDEFTLEPGISVSIAFDGDWERSENKWVFVTDEYPYLFWVDAYGNLKVQRWDDDTSRITLATGVVQCDAIKGWSNVVNEQDDQGVIVAYIKSDDKLYYRNFAYDGALGYKQWEPEREITLTGVTGFSKVSLFRTNDYRTGFVIATTSGEIYWKITERNWAGMAVGAEVISTLLSELNICTTRINLNKGFTTEAINAQLNDLTILDIWGVSPYIKLIENIDDGSGNWGVKIRVSFNCDIFNIIGQESYFSLYDDTNTYPCTEISEESSQTFIFEFTDFNAAYGLDVTFQYNADGTVAGPVEELNLLSEVFTPINLVAPEVPAPIVTNITNIEGDSL